MIERMDSRESIRREVAEFPAIMEKDPDQWWRGTARMLIGFRNRAKSEEDPEIRDYLTLYINKSLSMLRNASKLGNMPQDQVVDKAEEMIMDISMEMAANFEKKELSIETHFISLNELVEAHPARLKVINRVLNGTDCIVLQVKHPLKDSWQEIPLPKDEKIWHKGGPARAVLDLVANAPLSMQLSEFPWNDFDVVIAGKNGGIKAAKAIGVDSDGIENMGSNDLDFERFCYGRDTQQNQVCIGSEGLYYSQDALMSSITGHVNIVGEYIANKAIYGIDRVTVKGVSMAKQRGLMRLVKAVAEGKALSFDHIPLNSNFDLGVYILFLGKRWAGKKRFPELLQKMHYLLNQMGQVREGESDIFEVLERAHIESPFFDFDSEVRLPLEVVRWKSRKLVKQIDRESAWQFKFPTTLNLRRRPGDEVPYRISLDGYSHEKESESDMQQRWLEFINRSKKRTSIQQEKERSAYDKIFGVGFEDTDDLGVGFDELILDDQDVT